MSSKQQLAQEIFDEGKVTQINDEKWEVTGSGKFPYEVEKVQDDLYNYEYYCKCPAWKFDNSRECKHVLAVKLHIESGDSYSPKNVRVGKNKATGWYDQSSRSQFKGGTN